MESKEYRNEKVKKLRQQDQALRSSKIGAGERDMVSRGGVSRKKNNGVKEKSLHRQTLCSPG